MHAAESVHVSGDVPPGVQQPRRRPRTRRLLGLFAAYVLGIASGLGGVAGWATHRYVVDDVAIEDVVAFEAELRENADQEVVDGPESPASVEISTEVVGQGDNQVTYFVADIQLSDVTQLLGGFAENKFGQNIIANTSDIAATTGRSSR